MLLKINIKYVHIVKLGSGIACLTLVISLLMVKLLLATGEIVIVNLEHLNMREGPGSSYEIIQTLSVGDKLKVLDQHRGWLKVVTFDDTIGWVYKQYIKSITDQEPTEPPPVKQEHKEKPGVEDKEKIVPKKPVADQEEVPPAKVELDQDKQDKIVPRRRKVIHKPFFSNHVFTVGITGSYHEPLNAQNSYSVVYNYDNDTVGGVWRAGARVGVEDLVIKGFHMEILSDYYTKTGVGVYYAPTKNKWLQNGLESRLTVMRIMVAGSYKFRENKVVHPYVGLGAGMASVEEKMNGWNNRGFKEHMSEKNTGFTFQVKTGISWTVKNVAHGISPIIEFGYDFIPGIIGKEGVSKYFGEDDIGGYNITVGVLYNHFF